MGNLDINLMRQAEHAGDVSRVGEVYLFKSDKFAKLDVDNVPLVLQANAVEKVKSLDIPSVVSAGFEIAEKWDNDDIRDNILLRGNSKGEVFLGDHYYYSMLPATEAKKAYAAEYNKISQVITDESYEQAESAEELPIAIQDDEIMWKFRANRRGASKEYFFVIGLWRRGF